MLSAYSMSDIENYVNTSSCPLTRITYLLFKTYFLNSFIIFLSIICHYNTYKNNIKSTKIYLLKFTPKYYLLCHIKDENHVGLCTESKIYKYMYLGLHNGKPLPLRIRHVCLTACQMVVPNYINTKSSKAWPTRIG